MAGCPQKFLPQTYRTHLTSITVTTSFMPDGFQLYCDRRHMISHLVAIELCQTACLSDLLLKKRYQIGSIPLYLLVKRKKAQYEPK
jgi:hypothetical protein